MSRKGHWEDDEFIPDGRVVPQVDDSRSWIDDTKFIQHALDSRYELVSLANAFARTGNSKVADELYAVIEELEAARDIVNSMMGKVSMEGLNQARQGTRNVLTMAMMVIDPKNESGLRDELPKLIP